MIGGKAGPARMVAYNLSNLEILVVEENPFVQKILRGILREFNFSKIRIHGDGEVAYNMFRNYPADLVFMGWSPALDLAWAKEQARKRAEAKAAAGGDGAEAGQEGEEPAAEEAKAEDAAAGEGDEKAEQSSAHEEEEEERPAVNFLEMVRMDEFSPNRFVPVIVCSSFTEEHQVKRARDMGMTEFLAMPISARTVYGRICAVIEHPRPFVRSPNFFGPDRRRRQAPFSHEERRVAEPQIELPEGGA